MEGDRENSTATDQLEKELRRLRANFLNKLPGRLQALVEEWNALQGDGWSQDGARALHRSVHGLIGTAGSLGFSKMAKTARRLERRLVAMLEGKQPPTPEVSAEVIEWYERMGEDATAHAQQAVDPSSFENVAEWGAPIFEPRNLIVVVEQEDPFARELAHQLGHFGFELQMFKKIDDLVADGVERRPAAVIMDLSSPEGDLLGEEVATKVRDELGDDVPLVFVSNRSDIEARLDAVRSGCNSYFVKPVNYSDVLETLDRLT
jgi:CheY-like chemotaxis protein